jgi:hypothetical protein
VEAVAAVIDRERLLKRLLADSMQAFGVESGAIYWIDDGDGEAQPKLVDASADWDGKPALTMPLDCHGLCVGWLMLGPRPGGEPYSDAEQARLHLSLERTAELMLLVRSLQVTARSKPSSSGARSFPPPATITMASAQVTEGAGPD